ncbi:MAG: sensor histidine kinase [Planctomycetota bacterium]
MLAERVDLALPELLQGVAALLPRAWKYPEIASARILLDGDVYATDEFGKVFSQQTSPVIVRGAKRGLVEVRYAQEAPQLDEGPFLSWERNLIDAVARKVAFLVERREAREEQARLREQLLHADRLATIGQLAGGVAHELNEPLTNICGFAELCLGNSDLSEQETHDLKRIVQSALHAREIIQRLLLFARKAPSKTCRTDVNGLIEKALSLFESRFKTGGIEAGSELDDKLPRVIADPGQLNQVLVNLVVNAIQAMPDGGVLTVRTAVSGKGISLAVEDTGSGISDEQLPQIFLPFFTTKDIQEGTGLGLAVVHGIVKSHHGHVDVESEPGRTRFVVWLPLEPPASQESDSSDDCIIQ